MAVQGQLRKVEVCGSSLFLPPGQVCREYKDLSDAERQKIEYKDGKICHDTGPL
jgi:hypothetical protein